ncbi:MAG: hypothetical protein JWO74_1364 [Solirubrobacterales bacterium]|jgi:hypothetical protein|nr:hypothetical protein [Solirubrobacterales bacterium]
MTHRGSVRGLASRSPTGRRDGSSLAQLRRVEPVRPDCQAALSLPIHMLRQLLISALAIGTLLSTAAPANGQNKPRTNVDQRVARLEAQVVKLQHDVDVERAARVQLGDDSHYYFGSVAIIVGIATLLIAIVALGATFAGYRLVRDYVTKEFDRRAGDAFDNQVGPLIDGKLDAATEKFDAELAKMVAAARQAMGQNPA